MRAQRCSLHAKPHFVSSTLPCRLHQICNPARHSQAMRQTEQRPSKVIDIPYGVQKNGWWLVVDNVIPCTGEDGRCSGLTLVSTRGAGHNHAGSGHNTRSYLFDIATKDQTPSGMCALVAFADYLVLTGEPGVSWFVSAVAMALVIAGMALARNRVRAAVLALALVTIAALPIIEAPSLPGLIVALLALAIAALWRHDFCHHPR